MRPLALFVDDDGDTLDSIWTLLKAELPQINVLGVHGAEAGLRAVESTYPDIIVADLRMPKMDGLVFLREAGRRHPKVPLILTTGAPESEYREQSKAVGVTEVLRKPFPPADLIALLARHISLDRFLKV